MNWIPGLKTTGTSGSQRSPGAVVDRASEDVPVVPRDREMVVHVAVAALLVLEQQGWMVEGRELDEPMVEVGEVAPLDLWGGELREAGSCATNNNVRRRLEWAAVVVRCIDNALALQNSEVAKNQFCFTVELRAIQTCQMRYNVKEIKNCLQTIVW